MSVQLNNTNVSDLFPMSSEAMLEKFVEHQENKEPLTYLVEDDKANNFLCKMTLEEVGITNVRSFFRAEPALADLKEVFEKNEELPSLILLDINMPAMDGWAFLGEYRKLPEAMKSKITILLFSSSDHPRDLEKMKYFPEVLDFVMKPMSEEVASTLKEKYFRNRIAA